MQLSLINQYNAVVHRPPAALAEYDFKIKKLAFASGLPAVHGFIFKKVVMTREEEAVSSQTKAESDRGRESDSWAVLVNVSSSSSQ